jgi:hypothetical protein
VVSAHSARGFLDREHWGGDATELYIERLAQADELGLDTAPGSPSEATAAREAHRLAAGLPPAWWPSRGAHAADIAIEIFGVLPDLELPHMPASIAHGRDERTGKAVTP